MKSFLSLVALVASSFVACSAPPPPVNDNFADRISLVASGSITTKGVNAKATTEAGEPTISGDVVTKSVWWAWSAPFAGPATISTVGSSFDTLLGVFAGSTIATLSSVAENDDAGGLFTSSVTFAAEAGVPYVILVGGFNEAGGKVTLNVQVAGGPCAYSLTPSSRSVAYTAGASSVAVTTTTGCTWSAVSNDSWLTVTGGSSGSGSGTVTYSIAANAALSARSGTLTVAGLTHTVTQAAAPACSYSILPTSASFTSSAATNSFAMTAGTGCAWVAVPNASWVTIQSGASGSGPGTTTYVVATNSLSGQRTSTITVAGQTHTITQAGATPCTYSISPTSAPFTSAGGTSNIVVSTVGSCAWTASSPVAWVTFSSTNGVGNGTVTYTVAANATTISRSTTLTVAGNPFTVTQTGAACTYGIAPTAASVGAGTSSGSVVVTAGTGCAWIAVANVTWLTVTSGASGSGNGSTTYSVTANPDTASRIGTLTIGGQTFTVTQAAAACTYTLDLTAAHYEASGGSGAIAVTAGTGCAWTAVSNAGWITVDSGSPGSGSGTVAYTVAANATSSSRTGTITVAAQTFTVTQDGTTPCSYGISPSSASFGAGGGSGSVAVTANTGCTWSASSGASWITGVTPSGSGNGTVSYTVAANTSSLPRSGTITIAGNPFTVSQSGAACTYSTTPTAATHPYTGGSGSVTVTATTGCSWTTSSDSTWLTVSTGSSGTGNGTVSYSVASYSSPTNRTGRLTIAGRITTITQTGAPCVAFISPTSATVTNTGGGGVITLTESDGACAWTAVPSATWISASPSSGSGSASIIYNVQPTSLATSRSGTITVAGQVFSITQSGDTTAPTVTLTSPANGSTISNVVAVTATATDDSSVARVEFYRGSGTLLGTDFTSPYSVSFNTTNVANGSHTFYARGFDPAGNQGLSTTNTVTVSNTAVVSTNQWAYRFGGTASDEGWSLAIDSTRSIIAAGYFSNTADFGGGNLTSAGAFDIFVAKYSETGTPAWSKRFGSTGDDRAYAVAVDTSDNVVVVGAFQGTVDFGGGNLVSAGANDIFVAKYNSAGVFQWARRFGLGGTDEAYSVAADSSGAVYFTGTRQGAVDFGGGPLSATGGLETFIVKLDSSGTYVWAPGFVNLGDNIGYGVALDSAGKVVIVGIFAGRINFGGTLLATLGIYDIFVAQFATATGAHSWSKSFGSSGSFTSDYAYGVAIDTANNVLFTGHFKGTISFGGASLASANSITYDPYVAKLDSSGNHVWSRRAGGTSDDLGFAVGVDSSNNVLITGNFQGTANFSGSSITSAGNYDAYVAKYTSAGALTWARSAGGFLYDVGRGIRADANLAVIITGSFQGTGSFNGTSLTSAGLQDVFLFKVNP